MNVIDDKDSAGTNLGDSGKGAGVAQIGDARNCQACHGANGEGGVGKAIAGSPIATGDLATHMDVVIHGVPGTAMQAFGGQLNDVDMAAVLTYQRSAFGNNMGDKVQPIDVFNHKKG